MQSRLASLLERNGFTLYTPFRTHDLPGTIFTLSRDHNGRWVEFPVSEYDETFSVPSATLFPKEGEAVEFSDALSETFTFDSSAVLDLASALVNTELASQWSSEFTLQLGDPKRIHRISLARLGGMRDDISDDLRSLLKNREATGILSNAYIVVETLTVENISIKLSVDPRLQGTISAEKLGQLAKANATASLNGNRSIVVESNCPLIIGYKAIQFPSGLLRDSVSSSGVTDLSVVSASSLGETKRNQ